MDVVKAMNTELRLRKVLETLVDSIEAAPALSEDNLVMKPPGNFLASEIKAIHDDSKSVFPESIYSNVMSRRNRWKSIYDSEFYPRSPDVYEKWYGEHMSDHKSQRMKAKPLSAPVFTSNGKPAFCDMKCADNEKMFVNWKIPQRITEESLTSRKVPNIGKKFSGSADRNKTEHVATEHLANDLPHLTTLRSGFEHFNKTGNKGIADKSKFVQRHQSKSFRTQKLLNSFSSYPTFSSLDAFLSNATQKEKNIVEKTMKLIYTKDLSSGTDTNKTIEKWFSTASAEDRVVALNFFESIGVKMMANSTQQQCEAIEKVLALLKNHESSDELTLHRSRTLNSIKTTPKYVRLLTPSTRANKWLHQTWHHLPNYKDDNPVFNKSAIYTESGKIPFRHWNIHPDWQLQKEFQ